MSLSQQESKRDLSKELTRHPKEELAWNGSEMIPLRTSSKGDNHSNWSPKQFSGQLHPDTRDLLLQFPEAAPVTILVFSAKGFGF